MSMQPTTVSTSDAPMTDIPTFAVITGAQVADALRGRSREIVDLVEQTYLVHASGQSVNPPSYFLRFTDRPTSRIIALPAALGGPFGVDGIKWVSSFPGNVEQGIPRASAVLLLNDHDTGYPFACLEGSIISATRTAASAVLAADRLSRTRSRPTRVGFVGLGLIARYIHTFFVDTGWEFDEIGVHDLAEASTAGFTGYLEQESPDTPVWRHQSVESLICASDLVVFATVAARPYVHDPSCFDHHPIVLNVSLRDLAPGVLLQASNYVDDVDHCLKADTSPHLTEQVTGNRDFLTGTLAEAITGRVAIPDNDTIVFSPFGLGVLDLALGLDVYRHTRRAGSLQTLPGFFHDLQRHGG